MDSISRQICSMKHDSLNFQRFYSNRRILAKGLTINCKYKRGKVGDGPNRQATHFTYANMCNPNMYEVWIVLYV